MSEWGEEEVNRIFQEQDVEAVLELLADKKRLDKLDVMKIASLETVFYAIQRDFPVPVREAIDRVDLGEGEQ